MATVVNLSAPASTSNANVILEQDEYYPFGTRIEPAGKTQATNRYRYAGKEEQNIAGMDLDLLDFGARYYDAFVGRWNAIDPMAILFCQTTSYQYCLNNPVKYFDPLGLWAMDDQGYVVAEKGDDLYSFAEFMNTSPNYAFILLVSQGINPMDIKVGTIFNSEAYNGSISPSFCSPNESDNGMTLVSVLGFSLSNIKKLNPFEDSDTKFRVKNSKGNFDFKAYNDKFYSNQYITKDMLFPVKPITSKLMWLGRLGNVTSVAQIGYYSSQASFTESSYDRFWAIVDVVNCGLGLMPGLPAVVSLLGGSNTTKLYMKNSAPIYSSNPMFCPLR